MMKDLPSVEQASPEEVLAMLVGEYLAGGGLPELGEAWSEEVKTMLMGD